jgi:serine/threonine protein kinase
MGTIRVRKSALGSPPAVGLFAVVDKRYKPLQELGTGGVCRVDLATDLKTGEEVALKRPHPFLKETNNAAMTLWNEAVALSLITHPGIPDYVSHSEADGNPYVVMEHIGGPTFGLNKVRDRFELLSVFISVCDILSALHELGIVHRDVKPSNILLRPLSRAPVLIDYGYSLVPGMPDYSKEMNTVVGTARYMAPEQTLPGGRVDKRADIYSVGILLYSYLSGQYPYVEPANGGPEAVMRLHRTATAPPMHEINPRVPPRLSRVVCQAMSREPARRFSSALELADALSDCLELMHPL